MDDINWDDITLREKASMDLEFLLHMDIYKLMDIRFSGAVIKAIANPSKGTISIYVCLPNFKDGMVIESQFEAKSLLKLEEPSTFIFKQIIKEVEEADNER